MKQHTLLGLALAAGWTLSPAQARDTAKPHRGASNVQRMTAQHITVQRVTVAITSRGYSPSVVNVRAGRPVRMTFVSREPGCGNAVVIPALRHRFALQPGQRRVITFTPRRGQNIAFACSMQMFQGRIVAR